VIQVCRLRLTLVGHSKFHIRIFKEISEILRILFLGEYTILLEKWNRIASSPLKFSIIIIYYYFFNYVFYFCDIRRICITHKMQNVIDVSRKLKRNLVLENVILCEGWSKMVKLYIYIIKLMLQTTSDIVT